MVMYQQMQMMMYQQRLADWERKKAERKKKKEEQKKKNRKPKNILPNKIDLYNNARNNISEPSVSNHNISRIPNQNLYEQKDKFSPQKQISNHVDTSTSSSS